MSNKKKQTTRFFFGEKRKTEKESLTEVYKDSKNVKKGYRWRQRRDNPRARKIKK